MKTCIFVKYVEAVSCTFTEEHGALDDYETCASWAPSAFVEPSEMLYWLKLNVAELDWYVFQGSEGMPRFVAQDEKDGKLIDWSVYVTVVHMLSWPEMTDGLLTKLTEIKEA